MKKEQSEEMNERENGREREGRYRKVKKEMFAPRALMSVEEVAQYLNLSTQTIYNWLHKRRINGIKIGKVWRFDKQEIDSWLKGKMSDTTTPQEHGEK